jgi:hypothetical protein
MLIRYKPKQDHLKCVPLIPSAAETKNLKLERTQVQLLPGINEVSDDEWQVMKPHLAGEIKSGVIKVVEKEVKKSSRAPDGKARNLKELPSMDAVALVGETVNPDTLNKWYQEETREEVRLTIVEHMKELKMEIPKFKPISQDDDSDANSGDNPEKSLEDMTKEELIAYAESKGITVSGNKPDIFAAIKAAEDK